MEVQLGEEKVPFGIDFHPEKELVAASLVTGDFHLYRYNTEKSSLRRLLDIHAHGESCRAVRFIHSGQGVATASLDCSILASDVETGAPIARLENAHRNGIYCLINLTESTIASGDDEGCIKVWDTRQRACCNSFNAHKDYVSDMFFVADSMKLLGTSGDGTLSVCNLRSNRRCSRSEFSEEELTSVVVMKDGKKVICGSQNGNLLLYSWGFFKDCSDRFVDLSSNTVDVLLKFDEDRLISGSNNGLISLVGILPNKVIQPIAEHSNCSVEGLALSHDRKCLGSISYDWTLKASTHSEQNVAETSCNDVMQDLFAAEIKDRGYILWDLETILQCSGEVGKGKAALDADTDEMDLDESLLWKKRSVR